MAKKPRDAEMRTPRGTRRGDRIPVVNMTRKPDPAEAQLTALAEVAARAIAEGERAVKTIEAVERAFDDLDMRAVGDTINKLEDITPKPSAELAEIARTGASKRPPGTPRRQWGSEQGRLEKQARFVINIFGGKDKGEGVKPSVGRLANALKALDNLIQTFDREGNEFTKSQGRLILLILIAKFHKLYKVIQAEAKPDEERIIPV